MQKTLKPALCWPQMIITSALFSVLFGHLTISKLIQNKLGFIEFMMKITPFFIFIIVLMIIIYISLSYIIDDHRIIVKKRLISHFEKEVLLTHVKEISLYRGPLQRLFGLGSIRLTTHGNSFRNGIMISNVRNPDELHDFLKKRVTHKSDGEK